MSVLMAMSASRTTEEYLGELTSDLQRQVMSIAALPRVVWSERLAFEMVQVVRPEITQDEVMTAAKRIRFSSCVERHRGQWFIIEPIRTELLARLCRQESANNIMAMRSVIIKFAMNGEGNRNGNGKDFYSFEACYQVVLMPDMAERGFRKFADLVKGAAEYRRQMHISELLRLEKHFRSLGVPIPGWFFALIGETPTRVIV
jgi:hypothetical protein